MTKIIENPKTNKSPFDNMLLSASELAITTGKKYYEEPINLQQTNLFTITIIGGSQGAKIFDNLFTHYYIVLDSKVSMTSFNLLFRIYYS